MLKLNKIFLIVIAFCSIIQASQKTDQKAEVAEPLTPRSKKVTKLWHQELKKEFRTILEQALKCSGQNGENVKDVCQFIITFEGKKYCAWVFDRCFVTSVDQKMPLFIELYKKILISHYPKHVSLQSKTLNDNIHKKFELYHQSLCSLDGSDLHFRDDVEFCRGTEKLLPLFKAKIYEKDLAE